MTTMLWDWDLWPGIIAFGAAFGWMSEQMQVLTENLTRMAEQIGTALLPAMRNLAAALGRIMEPA